MSADDRPLGDTTEAHDEISPRDLPPDHPARAAAEEQARRHGDGTTRGPKQGAAAGDGGSEQDTPSLVSGDEAGDTRLDPT